MSICYTAEKNIQILLALLKAHNVRKVVVSPGTTNVSFVASMQYDSFFELYSAPDERSAAYIACGMAEESREPIVITCTGATASRNYVSGLTEAYYRKLPVLAITASQMISRVGQNIAQVIDRSTIQKDIAKLSINLPICNTKEDEWACNLHTNRAILELTRNGGGPVHINMETTYNNDFSTVELPVVTPIFRVEYGEKLPDLPSGKIAVYVGAHSEWDERLTEAVDSFCNAHDAIVLCDQTSNYRGKYRVLFSLATSQVKHRAYCSAFDLIINIGDVSGAYPWFDALAEWRVNPDGEIRDTFGHLKYVFQMKEIDFFSNYSSGGSEFGKDTYLMEWKNECDRVYSLIPELPFSNIWLASKIAPMIPGGSAVHLGILNTLRSWNFFETPSDVLLYSNTGGFGIDGVMSATIGAALCNPEKLFYCIVGDLAFFYDMNSLGNRHVTNNLRILLINNGKGTEFRNFNHRCAKFGDDADLFMAAGGHYGNKSKSLVKHYAEDLGFDYFAVHTKEEALKTIPFFVDNESHDKPLIIEAFLDSKDENEALFILYHLIEDKDDKTQNSKSTLKADMRGAIKNVIGNKGLDLYRSIRYGKNREK